MRYYFRPAATNIFTKLEEIVNTDIQTYLKATIIVDAITVLILRLIGPKGINGVRIGWKLADVKLPGVCSRFVEYQGTGK